MMHLERAGDDGLGTLTEYKGTYSQYLENRRAKGFTVIQAVALAEFDGLGTPNRQNHLPLIDHDPTKPNEAYFRHVDAIVRRANELGILVAFLPTWADKVPAESRENTFTATFFFFAASLSIFCVTLIFNHSRRERFRTEGQKIRDSAGATDELNFAPEGG